MPDLHPPTTENERIETLLHQLRNPLTAIATFAKLLDKRRPDDDPDGWIVERIAQECQHMNSLLDGFEDSDVDLSTGNESEQETSPSSWSLKTLVNDLWPTYAALAAEQGIDASLEDALSATTTVAATDASNALGLREAIDNLMDNALKYTPTGGTVVLSASEEGDTIALRVKDTGPGIASTDLSQIFQRHVRLDGDRPGHGLGLAIARDLVTSMGGELTVESELGEGTIFTIRLPVAALVEHPR